MALIKCQECAAKISDQANHCVKCGFGFLTSKTTLLGGAVRWLFVLMNLSMFLLLFYLLWAAGKYTPEVVTVLVGFFAPSLVEFIPLELFAQGFTIIITVVAVLATLSLWASCSVILGAFVWLTRPKLRKIKSAPALK